MWHDSINRLNSQINAAKTTDDVDKAFEKCYRFAVYFERRYGKRPRGIHQLYRRLDEKALSISLKEEKVYE